MIPIILILLAISVCFTWWQIRFFRGKITTWGTVTDTPSRVDENVDAEGYAKSTFAVVAAFRDREGMPQQFHSAWNRANPGYAVGEQILLFYDPSRPRDTSGICSFSAHFSAAFTFIWIALVLAQATVLWPVVQNRTDNLYLWFGAGAALVIVNLGLGWVLWQFARTRFHAFVFRHEP